VRSALRDEQLLISTGHNLDFGDICAGSMQKRQIILKNVGEKPLDVTFSSDNSEEIAFELLSEDTGLKDEDELKSFIKSKKNSFKESSVTRASRTERKLTLDSSAGNSGVNLYAEEVTHETIKNLSDLSLTISKSTASSVGSSLLHEFDHLKEFRELSSDKMFGSQDLLPSNAAGQTFRIEELNMRPGAERIILVCYSPFREDLTPDYRTSKLLPRTFKLFISYFSAGVMHNTEKSTIQCVARTCTSAIEVTPRIIRFGDTDVCTLKSANIEIKNHSELPTYVELNYASKVLSSVRGEQMIPAKQKIDIKLDIFPRKVNPDYRKEIVVVNLLNPTNNQTIEVFSTNVDKQMVTIHSSFYRIWTPKNASYIDFGNTVLNAISIRSMKIENITDKPLKLSLSIPTSNDVIIYRTEKKSPKVNYNAKKELLLQKIEQNRLNKKTADVSRSAAHLITHDYKEEFHFENSFDFLDLAVDPRRKQTVSSRTSERHSRSTRSSVIKKDHRDKAVPNTRISNLSTTHHTNTLYVTPSDTNDQLILNFEKMTLKNLLKLAEAESGEKIPLFASPAEEEAYVKRYQTIRSELLENIKSGKMIPVKELEILPQAQETLYLYLCISSENRNVIQVY
jgi:hypothetical protein